MTEVWTTEQYRAYLAGHQEPPAPPSVPRFLTLDPDAPEDVLRGRLQQLCQQTGYLYYHALKSQGSTPGWPDVALVHPEGDGDGGATLFLWELKREGAKPGGAQQRWLDALAQVTRVAVGVYQPRDWAAMVATLGRRR